MLGCGLKWMGGRGTPPAGWELGGGDLREWGRWRGFFAWKVPWLMDPLSGYCWLVVSCGGRCVGLWSGERGWCPEVVLPVM